MICIKKPAVSSLTKQERQDSQTVFALCVILFFPALNNFVNAFVQIGLGLPLTFFTPISYIFMALMSIVFLYKLILRKRSFSIIFVVCVLGSILSYSLYPEIRTLIYSSPVDLVYSPVNKLIFFCFPAFMGAACLNDYNKLFEKMHIWSLITATLGVVTYVFVTFLKGELLQYMVYSYFLLLPVCVCFEYAFMKKTKLDLIVALVASASMVACGARGAIVSLLLYFAISFFHYNLRQITLGQMVRFFVLLFSLVIVVLFYNELLDAIAGLFEQLNIDSRFISYLKDGVLFEDSGRDSISKSVKKGLTYNPFGFGIYGDRYVAGHFGSDNYRYVHNIFMEMFCDFGIIGGSVFIALIIFAVVLLCISAKGKKEIYLVFSLIPYALFQLLFSSSYLENIPFFVLMGMAIYGSIEKRFIVKWR